MVEHSVYDPTGKMGDRRTTDTPQISFSGAAAAANGAGASEAQPMPMSRNEDKFHIKIFTESLYFFLSLLEVFKGTNTVKFFYGKGQQSTERSSSVTLAVV